MPATATSTEARSLLDPSSLAKISKLELIASQLMDGYVQGLHRSPHLGFALDFRHEILVPLNVGTAGRANLDERELLPVRRLLFQKPLDSAEPLWNSFRVVDAIDTHTQEGSLDAQVAEQCGSFIG